MTKFWLIQIGVIALIFFNEWKRNIEMMLLVPYSLSIVFILIIYLIFNRGKNPFTKMDFWIWQVAGAVTITVGIFFFFLCALGGGDSYDDNLANDIKSETITSITIIQKKDTVHLDSIYPFIYKLDYVEHVTGPVKYPIRGKILFYRKDGSKDSINTNGYGYGPYKGKWYQSRENVLEEYFKRK